MAEADREAWEGVVLRVAVTLALKLTEEEAVELWVDTNDSVTEVVAQLDRVPRPVPDVVEVVLVVHVWVYVALRDCVADPV